VNSIANNIITGYFNFL